MLPSLTSPHLTRLSVNCITGLIIFNFTAYYSCEHNSGKIIQMKKYLLFIPVLLMVVIYTSAQTTTDSVTAVILHLDSGFWNAYNRCDTGVLQNYLEDDVEFYHDKSGVTIGAPALIQSLEKNLCSNANYHLRREAVAGTVKVYVMQQNNETYGAIITGEHVFYITQDGKPEFLDGDANFTHLWLLKNNVWKMARILSYNHHAATYVNTKKEIQLSSVKLDKLTGNYSSTQSGKLKLKRQDDVLILYDDKNSYTLYPQTEISFFTKDRDLVFNFILDASGKPEKMIVLEHGAVADELIHEH
jgi:hypothetical protein